MRVSETGGPEIVAEVPDALDGWGNWHLSSRTPMP
jgi:hypothetical protein